MHKTFPKDNFGHRFFWVEIRRRTKFCLCSTTVRPQGRFGLQVDILCSSSNLNQKKSMVKIIFRKSFVYYKIALYMPSMGFIAHELIRKQPTWISFTLSLEIVIGRSEHLWTSWELITDIRWIWFPNRDFERKCERNSCWLLSNQLMRNETHRRHV